jgi:dihydroorotase
MKTLAIIRVSHPARPPRHFMAVNRCIRLAAVVLLASPFLAARMQPYDLILAGGHVIDPRNGVDAAMDVAIAKGRIVSLSPRIEPTAGTQVLDVRGLIITPGLIDIHVHLFATTGLKDAWAGDQSVMPDAFSFRAGVTTMVDAGSSGWRNFETFRHTVIDRAKTRVLAMINIAGLGMSTNAAEQVPAEFQPAQVALLAAKHKDVVVGVKSAHYEAADWTSVERAVEAGIAADIPVMVDFGYFRPERPYWQLVTEKLRPGDISTHCFRASVPWIDDHGGVYEYLGRARDRGVKFDVGHGAGSLVFRNAVPAIKAGFFPDSISTDLHGSSMNIAMMDMLTTMSKFLVMGMPLNEVILRSTWNPARMIRRPALGHLSPGAVADVAVLRVDRGEFVYADAKGGRMRGGQRILCELTLREGQVVWDWNARAAADYTTLPRDYGLREGIDVIVLPK